MSQPADTHALAHRPAAISREQVDLLKRTICKGATDDELSLFVQTTERLALDPFARQVFAVKRWDKQEGRLVMAIQVSIDGFRLVAERTGKYAGQLGPFWTGDGKEWLEVWLGKDPPAAAKVGIIRHDFKEPVWAVATWDQYKQEGQKGLTPMWAKMGPLMLAKCAESLGLRRAFPHELSGVYTAEEMAQATPVDYEPPAAGNGIPRAIDGQRTDDAEYNRARMSDAMEEEPRISRPPQDLVEVIDGKTGEVTQEPRIGAGQATQIGTLVSRMGMTPAQLQANLMKLYKVSEAGNLSRGQADDWIRRCNKKLDAAKGAMASVSKFAEPADDRRNLVEAAAALSWSEADMDVWCGDLFEVTPGQLTKDQKATALALLLAKQAGESAYAAIFAKAVADGKVRDIR